MHSASHTRRYTAFISYRHADNTQEGRRWAEWLHRALERYTVPPDLIGTPNLRGERIRDSLYPIFRDEDELPANADLATGIRAALEVSDHLIVLCSPRSAVSPWVRKEVREFKELGRSDRILAIIISGEPNADDPAKAREGILRDEECFCEELRFGAVRDDGTIDWNARTEPTAADLRPAGTRAEGFVTAEAYREYLTLNSSLSPERIITRTDAYREQIERSLLKVIAGLLGVHLGKLIDRDAAHRATLAEKEAERQRQIAERERALAEQARQAERAALRLMAEQKVLLEEAAQSDRLVAAEKFERGLEAQAFAHYARAVRYTPEAVANALASLPAILKCKLGHPQLTLKGHITPMSGVVFSGFVGVCEKIGQRLGQTAPISSAAFSPDGQRVLTASEGHTAHLWDAWSSGKELARFEGISSYVTRAIFSPDGRRVLTTVFRDSTARLWDADSGRELTRFEGHSGDVTNAAISLDGHRVLTASKDSTARLWDADSGIELARFEGHSSYVTSAVFSPDGQRVLTASWDGNVRLWKDGTAKELAQFVGHSDSVLGAVFSPDGKRVLTASKDKTARLWEAETGREIALFEGHSSEVRSAVFSPDGRRVLTAGDQTARLWDAESGEELAFYEGHFGDLESAVFSPDGCRILTASKDETARLWDADTGKELARFEGHSGYVTSAVFSPDGRRILTASGDHTARLWEAASRARLKACSGFVENAVFSPDGRQFLSVWGWTAWLWDADSAKELAQFVGHSDSVLGAVFSPDGKRILTASKDKTARLWEAETGREITRFEGHSNAVRNAVFSADGRRVLTSSADYTARLWEAETGKELARCEGHSGELRSAVFSPDGRLVLTASADYTARLWEAETGKELACFEGHFSEVIIAVFSPDGCRVLTAAWKFFDASGDKTARLWEADSGKQLACFEGHSDYVLSAAFSPDGRRVLTAGDYTARLWDADSGSELVLFEGHSGYVESAAFSPDGHRILTTSTDNTVRIWETDSGKELACFEGRSAVYSPDGRRLLAVWRYTARLWPLLPAQSAPPAWFGDFLTWLGGIRVEADGKPAVLSSEECHNLAARLREQAGEDSDYARLLRWHLAPAAERLIDPYGTVTRVQGAAQIVDSGGDKDALEYAYSLDPHHPLIHLALAAFEGNPISAAFLRRYSLDRLPDDATLWARAALSLAEQKDFKRSLQAAEKALKLDPLNAEAKKILEAAQQANSGR